MKTFLVKRKHTTQDFLLVDFFDVNNYVYWRFSGESKVIAHREIVYSRDQYMIYYHKLEESCCKEICEEYGWELIGDVK